MHICTYEYVGEASCVGGGNSVCMLGVVAGLSCTKVDFYRMVCCSLNNGHYCLALSSAAAMAPSFLFSRAFRKERYMFHPIPHVCWNGRRYASGTTPMLTPWMNGHTFQLALSAAAPCQLVAVVRSVKLAKDILQYTWGRVSYLP